MATAVFLAATASFLAATAVSFADTAVFLAATAVSFAETAVFLTVIAVSLAASALALARLMASDVVLVQSLSVFSSLCSCASAPRAALALAVKSSGESPRTGMGGSAVISGLVGI